MKLKELLVFGCVLCGCTNVNDRETIAGSSSDNLDAAEYPKVIDGGKRIVYQFSKMTPRGPHYFLDTVDYNDDVSLPLRGANFVFPLQLSASERDTAEAILAISLPGYFDETIIGAINHQQLRMKLKGTEVLLETFDDLPSVNADSFQVSFISESLRADVHAKLSFTQTGTHRAGSGTLQIFERDSLLQTCNIFLVMRPE